MRTSSLVPNAPLGRGVCNERTRRGWGQGNANASDIPIKSPLKQLRYNMFSSEPQNIFRNNAPKNIQVFDAGFDVAVMELLLVPSGFIVRVHIFVKKEPHT